MLQERATPPLLGYTPPERRRRFPLGRLCIAALAISSAHFVTFAVSILIAVGDDPWGANGWSTADRVVSVLSFPLLHLAWRSSADPDSVGWGWAVLNSAVWGLVVVGASSLALLVRSRLLHRR